MPSALYTRNTQCPKTDMRRDVASNLICFFLSSITAALSPTNHYMNNFAHFDVSCDEF